jgi:hypothetical protein
LLLGTIALNHFSLHYGLLSRTGNHMAHPQL